MHLTNSYEQNNIMNYAIANIMNMLLSMHYKTVLLHLAADVWI